ncbi:MAG: ABC transporter substrate-binding protein [Spirochaetaceae bacterium]|nr:ABC transporter substrate-binding protein [Spirochaetaceae bacterium]
MKKLFSIMAIATLVIVPIFSQAAVEEQNAFDRGENVSINLAVMAGPTGFGAAGLLKNEGKISDLISVNTKVYSSPTEVIAQIAKGTEDIAALPSNLSSVLYNKGLKIKLAAVIGNGMLSLVSSETPDPSKLVGQDLYIPGGPASTPNQLAKMLISANGLAEDSLTLQYGVTSAAQLSQLLIAEKVKNTILPEPFVTMVITKNPNVKKIYNLQEGYKVATGIDNYPMTVLVVQDKFAQEHKAALDEFLQAYKDSVAFVVANPEEAGKLIEQINIMPSAMATPAIPFCNLTYKSAQEAKSEVNEYFKMLFNFDPQSIGGKMPTDDFYL